MASLNRVTLIGNLGADVELKQTPSGHAVANLSVATSYKPKNGEEKTEWHRVTCWGQTAENCAKYIAKGSKVYVEGRLETRSWEKDGQKRYVTDIVAERVMFLSTKPGGQRQQRDEGPAGDGPPETTPFDEPPL
jgi:single-strand DNA-binding protein